MMWTEILGWRWPDKEDRGEEIKADSLDPQTPV